MNGLLTDLYELTMAAGYFETGKTDEKATFELAFRRLPANRNFMLAAGLPQLVDYLLNLSFTDEEIEYLRGLAQFRNVSPGFFDYLRTFRFTGDLFAMPEGTPVFPGEPVRDHPRADHRSADSGDVRAGDDRLPEHDRDQGGALRRGCGGTAGGRVRHAPRAHARSRRARRARRVHRRLRRHQQHAGRASATAFR